MGNMEEVLQKVKLALRISHNALDGDILDNISACIKDLENAGLYSVDAQDPMILNAVKMYCRAMYTDKTEDTDAWLRRYEALKGSLQMTTGYGFEEGDVDG